MAHLAAPVAVQALVRIDPCREAPSELLPRGRLAPHRDRPGQCEVFQEGAAFLTEITLLHIGESLTYVARGVEYERWTWRPCSFDTR